MNLKTIIEKLKKLDTDRTQGEWAHETYPEHDVTDITTLDGDSVILSMGDRPQSDANFICETANQMPKLLQALEIMQKTMGWGCHCDRKPEDEICYFCEALNEVDKLFVD